MAFRIIITVRLAEECCSSLSKCRLGQGWRRGPGTTWASEGNARLRACSNTTELYIRKDTACSGWWTRPEESSQRRERREVAAGPGQQKNARFSSLRAPRSSQRNIVPFLLHLRHKPWLVGREEGYNAVVLPYPCHYFLSHTTLSCNKTTPKCTLSAQHLILLGHCATRKSAATIMEQAQGAVGRRWQQQPTHAPSLLFALQTWLIHAHLPTAAAAAAERSGPLPHPAVLLLAATTSAAPGASRVLVLKELTFSDSSFGVSKTGRVVLPRAQASSL